RLRHLQVDGGGSLAGDDEGIEAGALHGGGPPSAEGRVAEEAGQRRFRGDAGAAIARHSGVGDGPHGEDHRVGRIISVDQRRHVIEEEPRRQPVAAEEGAGRALVETLDAARAACEIDEENPPAIALHGRAHISIPTLVVMAAPEWGGAHYTYGARLGVCPSNSVLLASGNVS